MTPETFKRCGIAALLAGLALALAGCLLSPGKFSAALDIRKDGAFTWRYNGEIVLLGLTRLAQADKDAKAGPFLPQACHEDGERLRPCTRDEVEEQRRTWQAGRDAATAKSRRDAEAAKAFLGGLDPTDPRSAEELAQRQRKQAGWRSVVYKGDGVFLVDFALTGRIDRDFAFPTIERMPSANPFITLSRRQDGTVRIDAPGFMALGSGGPFTAMLGGLGGLAAQGPGNKAQMAALPLPDGTFTLTTDAAILANNTEDGAGSGGNEQRLQWTIGSRTTAAPMAVLRLAAPN